MIGSMYEMDVRIIGHVRKNASLSFVHMPQGEYVSDPLRTVSARLKCSKLGANEYGECNVVGVA